MNLFGLEFSVRKSKGRALTSVDGRNGKWLTIYDSYPGAWQQNVEINLAELPAQQTVFACITLIANDVAKMGQSLMEFTKDGIWEEIYSPAFSPVLKKPNQYQNSNQFRKAWLYSKLLRGNTYVLKGRDARGVVSRLWVLDPDKVTPLVSTDGGVYYQLSDDNLSRVYGEIIVPSSEIIHDRMNALHHPLVGLSPLYAAGLAATQGLAMQNNAARLFTNMSRPSGILVAPGPISEDNAKLLKTRWEDNFTGGNFGKTAVLGDGMKYEKLSITAAEAQFIEQLDWTSLSICTAFHVPPFKVGIGTPPQNAEAANQIYYSDCLQDHIEDYEACMDEGLGVDAPINGRRLGVELNVESLIRLDFLAQVKMLAEEVKGTLATPNEGRKKRNRKPVKGGDALYMQQQNYSLEALSRRDAREDPFAKSDSNPTPAPSSSEEDETDKALTMLNQKPAEAFAHDD